MAGSWLQDSCEEWGSNHPGGSMCLGHHGGGTVSAGPWVMVGISKWGKETFQ